MVAFTLRPGGLSGGEGASVDPPQSQSWVATQHTPLPMSSSLANGFLYQPPSSLPAIYGMAPQCPSLQARSPSVLHPPSSSPFSIHSHQSPPLVSSGPSMALDFARLSILLSLLP